MIIQIIKFLFLNIIVLEFFLFFKPISKIKILIENLKNLKIFFINKKYLGTENEKEYFNYIGKILRNSLNLFFIFFFIILIFYSVKFIDEIFYKNFFTYEFIFISIIFSLIYIVLRIKLL